MKAVVVGKKDGKAIVVDTKGRFHEIKDSNDLIIGQEYERGMVWKIHKRLIAAGVSLAMVFTLGTTGYAYTVPVDYVTLDINPSVELGVNMFGTVVDINNFNEDGTDLTENLDLKGDTVDKALTELVKKATDKGYLTEENNNSVMVTVATKDEDDASDLQKLAEDAVTKELKNENLQNTEVIAQTVTKERQQEAKMMGISPGKILLIQKLQVFNSEVKLEDYANKSVKEIMKEIKTEKKSEKIDNKNDKKGTTGTKEDATRESKDSTEAKQEPKENKETKKQDKKEEKKNSNSVKEVIKEVQNSGATSTDESDKDSNSNVEQKEKQQEDKKPDNKKEEKWNNGKGNENGNHGNGNGKKDK